MLISFHSECQSCSDDGRRRHYLSLLFFFFFFFPFFDTTIALCPSFSAKYCSRHSLALLKIPNFCIVPPFFFVFAYLHLHCIWSFLDFYIQGTYERKKSPQGQSINKEWIVTLCVCARACVSWGIKNYYIHTHIPPPGYLRSFIFFERKK